MRTLLVSMLAVVALVNCMPCETADPVDLTPISVCHRADAGAIAPNTPFTLVAETYSGGSVCNVSIDGGSIRLDIPSSYAECSPATGGAAAPRGPVPTNCEVPALDAGTYVVQTNPPTTFTLPATADAGIPDCR